MRRKLISTRLTTEEKKLIENLAAIQGESISECTRRLLKIGINMQDLKMSYIGRLKQIKIALRRYDDDIKTKRFIRNLISDLITELKNSNSSDLL